MSRFRSILITGASSGIGRALALHYAQAGTTLALNGRDSARLGEVVTLCDAAGARVTPGLADVTDREALADWIAEVDRHAPLDLVVANAGISGGTAGGGESAEQARRIFAANVDGVLNTVHPAIEGMRARRSGQIAIMSSLASFRGFPGAPAYCASKAAVRTYGEALRGTLHGDGIGVSVICPGFVRSPMTDTNAYRMPLLMEADRAAAIIARGLEHNRARIAFPWRLYFLVWLIGTLSPALTDPLFRRLPAKG